MNRNSCYYTKRSTGKIEEDTIAAISTPLGEAGIGIVRISGTLASPICRRIFKSKKTHQDLTSHFFHYGEVIDPEDGTLIDEVLLVMMKSPSTYTREDVVEIHCHGGYVVLQSILDLVLRNGARLAHAGEFTRRAFLNGRIDLTQAEAVIDVIKAKTAASLELANQQLKGRLYREIEGLRKELVEWLSLIEAHIDFPGEEIEPISKAELQRALDGMLRKVGEWLGSYEQGKIFRDGASCAIVGKTNVGKSSLLNVLLNEDRAIVTPVAGTTRDVIEEILNVRGIPIRLMDTAGLRKPMDLVEVEGVRRTRERLEDSDFVLMVLDGSRHLDGDDREMFGDVGNKKKVIVLNKRDLPAMISKDDIKKEFSSDPIISVSALTTEGIGALREAIFSLMTRGNSDTKRESVILANLRHKIALEGARDGLSAATEGLGRGISLEFIAFEIRCGLEALEEIVGETTTEEILDTIFEQFCIGK